MRRGTIVIGTFYKDSLDIYVNCAECINDQVAFIADHK